MKKENHKELFMDCKEVVRKEKLVSCASTFRCNFQVKCTLWPCTAKMGFSPIQMRLRNRERGSAILNLAQK